MKTSIIGAISLTAALSGVGAWALYAEKEPRLEAGRFSGRIEVETPNRKESVSGQMLPYIRPGSVVRVLEGSAVFESDLHATVRAGKGDAFHFTTLAPEHGRMGAVRIAAIETEPKALEIAVGGEKFKLRKGGAISIVPTGRGEVTVKSEWGDVNLAAGSKAKNGSIRAKAHAMGAGESLIIPVSEGTGFDGPAMSLAGLDITRKSETRFQARSDGRAEETKAAGVPDGGRGAVASWPEASKAIAEAMIEKYGQPGIIDADSVSWIDNGSWDKTTVYRLPGADRDLLEQSVRYKVPEEKAALLSQLGLALSINPLDERLSSTSESEELNFLAVNLADEVVQGKTTVEEAREFYQKTVKLSGSGKSSSYMQGLQFEQ